MIVLLGVRLLPVGIGTLFLARRVLLDVFGAGGDGAKARNPPKWVDKGLVRERRTAVERLLQLLPKKTLFDFIMLRKGWAEFGVHSRQRLVELLFLLSAQWRGLVYRAQGLGEIFDEGVGVHC